MFSGEAFGVFIVLYVAVVVALVVLLVLVIRLVLVATTTLRLSSVERRLRIDALRGTTGEQPGDVPTV